MILDEKQKPNRRGRRWLAAAVLASTLAVTPCAFAEPAASQPASVQSTTTQSTSTQTQAQTQTQDQKQTQGQDQTQTQTQDQKQTQEEVNLDTSQLYEIRSAVGGNQVLDISGDSPVNSANLQIYSANNSNAQRFRFIKNDDGTYTIMTMAGARALDVRGGSSKNGTNVQQYTPNGTKAQKWKITKNTDGTLTFQPANAEKSALDVAGGKRKNGTNVEIYKSNGTAAQKWTLASKGSIPDYSANSMMLNPSYTSNTVLDVSGGSKSNGANIQVYQYNDSSAQQFNLKRQSDGSYMIQNAKSGKVLDVAGGSKRSGANVWQYSVNNTDAQKWIVTQSGDTYTFRNRGSGMVLDVNGASRNSGANVQVYKFNNTAAQKWHLVAKNRAVTNSVNLGSSFTAMVKNVNGKALSVSGSNVVMQSASWLTTKGWTFVRNLDHSYTLIPLSNKGKALDISSGSDKNGANVQIYNQNNSRAQKFIVVSKGSGRYTLMPEISTTRVIDVAGNSSKENTNVDLYAANNTKAQLFTIQKANASRFKTPDNYPQANAVLNRIGRNLWKAYNWSANLKYWRQYYSPNMGTRWYANIGFTQHRGNCYVMAATFTEMARALGYNAHQVVGYVPHLGGGDAPHSWVEIDEKDGTWVYDPNLTNELHLPGYHFKYGKAKTWRYYRYHRTKLK